MRFRKRLSAAILAIVMIVSSIQVPGGISYAAELAGSSIESGQNVSVLTAKDTKDIEAGGAESSANDGAITDDGSQTGDNNPTGGDSQTGSDNPSGDDQTGNDNPSGDDQTGNDNPVGDDQTGNDNPSGDDQTGNDNPSGDDQTGDDNPAGDDQTGDDNPAGDDQTGDDNPADDDQQTDDEDVDAGEESGDAPQLSVDGEISTLSIPVSSEIKKRDEYLYQEMKKRSPRIDIEEYQIIYGQQNGLVSGVLNEHPDLYFVKKTIGANLDATGTKITSLDMYYSDDYDDNAFEAGVDEALSCVNDDMSDLEKMIALHDYLAVNNEYDYENYQSGNVPEASYTAYGALVNHTSTCEGYALAYKYLLNKLGIECFMVTSASMKHVWNMVNLDGKYYHVDVTNDDPVWDRVGQVTHTYMLFSDDAHKDRYFGWNVMFSNVAIDFKATDDSYDYAFWKDSTAPVVFSGGNCYYVSDSGSIREGNCADIANWGPEIASIESWPTWDNSGTWPGVYSGLYMIDGRLYYNDNSAIYSIKTDGTDRQTAFTADTSNGYIYGSAYRQGKVYYALHKSPNLTTKENVLIAEITGVSGEEVDPSIPEVEAKEGYNITPPTPKEGSVFFRRIHMYDDISCDPLPPEEGACLVMFFNTDEYEKSLQLLKDIRDYSECFGAVKIIFIDVCGGWNNGSYVAQFFNNCEDRLFLLGSDGETSTDAAYGSTKYLFKEGVALDYAKAYCEAVKEKKPSMAATSTPCPSLFYIKDRKIQYAEMNPTSAYSIVSNLQKYCGYTRYALTYHLNIGDGNDIISETYDVSEEDLSLLTPDYRAGYCFDGWYSDAAFTKKVTKIPAGTKSNIELYAKWSLRKSGFDLENLEQEYTTLDDTTITSTADGKPKLLIFYPPDYYDTTQFLVNISEALEGNPEHALNGVDIYAIDWVQNKERVERDKQNTSDKIIFSADDSTYHNQNCLHVYMEMIGYKDSTPTICYIDAQNRFQYISGETDVDQIMFNLRTYCNYPTAGTAEFYMIRYELNGGKNNSKNPYIYNNEMTKSITLEDPEARYGYTFVGWYEDAAFTERVTEISPGREGDITLYAKWKEKKGLNADNPEYLFVTGDSSGQGTSQAVNGRPKVLIFGFENCGNSPILLKKLKENIDWFKGADIDFAVVQKTSIINANNFLDKMIKQYKCDGIKFYTDNGDNNTRLGDYVNKGKYQTLAGYIISPVVVYIDGNNKLQFTNTCYDAESVFNNLREYCNYDAYRIEYMLGGGTNNSENPGAYLGDSQPITLKDPTREGCTFEGWYKDIGYTKRVTEINPESRADYKLYAKWSVRKGGYGLENLEQEYTTLKGKTVNSTASGKPKVLIFGAKQTYTDNTLKDVKKELDKADSFLHGVDICVVAKGENEAEMFKMFCADTDEIIYTYSSDQGQQQKAYKNIADTKSGVVYNDPTIVYIDENNILQYVYPGMYYENDNAIGVPKAEDILKALKKYCDYPKIYHITYVLGGGKNSSENPATYMNNSETIALKAATREGYTFAGWYKDAAFTESEKVTEIPKGSKGDIKLYAKWRDASLEPGTYIITYMLNGGTNSSENPATYTSKTATIKLKDPVREGFIFEGWYKDAAFTEGSKLTEIVKGSEGDLTLYAKWKESEINVSIQRPAKTTYKTGQALEVTGGKIVLTSKLDGSVQEEKDLTLAMTAGFDSSKAGICKVMVTYDGYTSSFDTLIVEEPELIASYGQKLGDVQFPKVSYGTYAWAAGVDTEKVLDQTGTQTFAAVFTPKDKNKFSILEGLQISVAVKTKLAPEYVNIECIGGPYIYNKTGVEPEVKVTLSKVGNTDGEEADTLVKGTDYELSYQNNINAGTAKVIVNGINDYYGSIEKTFTIEPKELVIRARDKMVTIGGSIPTEYEYDPEGLVEGDKLIREPEITCTITSTEEEGEYEIIIRNADAGKNYRIIRYENGKLRVVSELVTCKVTFDMQGHGTAPTGYAKIPVGSTIDRPADPNETGYRFDGWYQDAACTKAWNFEADTVQSDITLYAKWLALDSDSDLAVQEIADIYYNGKAQKPAVSVYDQDKLLKAGKDYQIKYYNNINANADGELSKSGEFNVNLPYAEITGKGNYKDSVKINFNILKSPIEDAYGNPVPGVKLKVNDHLVKSAKPLTPFGSINYGKKLKADTDYELTLTSCNVLDASGEPVSSETYENAKIPANYTGEFLLTVKGKGNYAGSITRSVYVADKNHLMKNVKITLGKNLRNVEYTGERIEFTPANMQKPGNDEFVVTCGKTVLTPNEDYSVSYNNNIGLGKAELVVNGKGEYVGKKSVTFNIKGKTFSNGTVTVTGLEDKAYTGRAITQNKEAVLKWKADGKELVYGTDYTISYSKNINKGTATVTFTGMAEGGYSGKVSKRFKISAADISDENKVTRAVSMQNITLPYSKAGVKPVDEIILTNERGIRLSNGKDYTLAYKNNKAVADASGDKAPTVTVKGKGNYSGSFEVKFTIEQADLSEKNKNITIECTQVMYNIKNKNKPDYVYKSTVTIKDGKTKLKAGTDYEIRYERNTHRDFGYYMMSSTAMKEKLKPVAVITAKAGSAYTLQEPLEVTLQIYYMDKLKKNDLEVEIGEAVYTGGQVRPEVTVKYMGGAFTEGRDYTLIYGANNVAGKNKGSVTIKGLAPEYGGSVTYKFDITRKDLKYWFSPVIDEK